MSEPERQIEKLLQASAQERRNRAGGPFELHPATRRLLQGEVMRQYGAGRTIGSPAARWFQIWPRVAWSLGTFLVLGVAAWITWQSHHQQGTYFVERSTATNQVVKDELAAAPAPADVPVTVAPSTFPPSPLTAPAAPTPAVEVAKGSPAGGPGMADKRPQVLSAASTRPASSLPLADAKSKAAEPPAAFADSVTPSRNYAPQPLREEQPAATGLMKESSALAAAKPEAVFRRTDAAAATRDRAAAAPESSPASQAYLFSNQVKSPVTNALAAFTVEQNGADLKMVDADGSVYTGQVLVTEMETAPALVQPQSARGGAAGGPARYGLPAPTRAQAQVLNQNALNFRVAGTNRSLNQNVVFTGSFVPANEAANAQVMSNLNAIQNNRASNQRQLQNQFSSQRQAPWNNGRISGQAVIENKQTIAVEASPSQK